MKLYQLALSCCLFLSAPILGYYEEAKQEIRDLKTEATWRSMLIGYDAYYCTGQVEAYRKALLVINIWERRYKPKKPPKSAMKEYLLVLMSISNQEADEGFTAVEESWTSQGFRSALQHSISIIDGKPFVQDGLFH